MAQNVTIAGNQYPDVPSILIPKTGGGGNATFTDTSPTTASASDVAQGKIFFDSTGTQQTGTASGGGGTDFIVTLSYDSQSDMWIPDKTFAEIVAAYSAGKNIGTYAEYQGFGTSSYGYCNYEDGEYTFYYGVNVSGITYREIFDYFLNAEGVYEDGSSKSYYTDDATAIPADVANGKIFYNANGRQTGTASGGGGASNVVTGTFKGTTTNTAMDITLNYSGSGYPVAVAIYPTEGPYNDTTGSFYNLIQRYTIATYYCVKAATDLTPTYPSGSTSDKANRVVYLYRYKSSTSDATTTANSGSTTYLYRDTDAASGQSNVFRIRSKTKMSVFIAGTSYGFAANIEYKYWVLYSS